MIRENAISLAVGPISLEQFANTGFLGTNSVNSPRYYAVSRSGVGAMCLELVLRKAASWILCLSNDSRIFRPGDSLSLPGLFGGVQDLCLQQLCLSFSLLVSRGTILCLLFSF